MAISNYTRPCSYRLGKLLNRVYFIPKSHKLRYSADNLNVEVTSELTDVKRCVTYSTVYEQNENEYGKYRFENNLEFVLLEEYTNAMMDVLRDLRINKYYVVIEDKDNTFYMLNPDSNINISYDYTFTTEDGEQNMINVKLSNTQNHPLLILVNNISNYTDIYDSKCLYNYSQPFNLRMTLFGDLKVKDENGKMIDVKVDDPNLIKSIDFLPKSFNVTETYENGYFNLTMKFNIELSDFKYTFPYNMIEFPNNKYSAVFQTNNNNLIFCGINSPLIPRYQIQTSDDDGTLNIVTITLTSVSLYPILVRDFLYDYRWIDANDNICIGYDLYQQLKHQVSDDFGASWTDLDEPYKLGDLIEENSRECGWEEKYRWVDAGESCLPEDVKKVMKFVLVEGDYICENGCKKEKLQIYESDRVDGGFVPTGEYVAGEIIENDSSDCEFLAVRWVEDKDKFYCFEVNEEYTRWTELSTECDGYDLYSNRIEEVSSNGVIYHQNGGVQRILVQENSCDCGYSGYTYMFDGETICGDEAGLDSSKYYEIWVEKDACTLEPTGKVDYRNPKDRYEWIFTNEYICGSELGSGYLNINKYEIWKKYDNCSKTFLEEFEYRRGNPDCDCGYRLYEYRNSHVTICGSEIGEDYEKNSEYEIWEEYEYCPNDTSIAEFTGNIEYRNPKPSYNCGLITYEWRLEDSNVCGNTLPEGTTETDTPPTNNN